ncbi:hypothetical protein VSH64_08150 [Amycolatopsis rhabdoformis]|uniref:GPI inositol-deacylase PGAP1-like alpha/beta domain-containing protein n=1 Tax=Amycolatopsis rhabdoformis TaxID=1448059 RepID=A0ABZ1IEG3_9PSEU|nr:hypothetical protein [Amycolatopsis rhabdoformis]WSE32078.1 hypothetical protein VSH64_08150 [Amycolatopsis rhabdoformis]
MESGGDRADPGADAVKRFAAVLAAGLAVCGILAAPASARAQNPADIHCAGVQLAPAPLKKAPDLNPDGSPVRITPDARGKFVPVVMVHGWTGAATHTDDRGGAFSHLIDLAANQLTATRTSRSLIGQLQRDQGTAVFTFDYHEYSARWVDDPHIGPALGDAIDCLYRATGEKVIVVAHSMGGLATRYALTHRGAAGADRAGEVSTVVTLGTPETGSLVALLGSDALDVGAATGAALAAVRLILATCGKATTKALTTGSLCDILPPPARAADSEAGRALRTGSPQLAALKPFPAGVTVHALYGDTNLTIPKAGWFHAPWDVDRVRVGDLIVMPDSATNGVKQTSKASCDYQLNPTRAATDGIGLSLGLTARSDVAQPITSIAGACFHGNLMRTIQLTNEVTGIVSDDVGARQPKTTVVTVKPVARNGTLAPGWTVADDGESVDCGTPASPSPAATGRDIVTCSPTAASADVCWTQQDRISLLCGWDPWTRTLHRNTAEAPVTPVAASSSPVPWALELVDGTKCRLRNGGAWPGRSDDYVGAYSCDEGRGELAVLANSADLIDKSTPMWTVPVGVLDDKASGSPPPRTVGIRVAYFASS